MNLKETLNNENSDELQKRIHLLGVTARDCPKRKNDRVEYLRGYLLSTELDIRIAHPTELRDRLIKLLPRPEDDRVAVTAESLARLVAEAGETGKYCFYASGRRVVVAEKSLRNFLNGLRRLGYVLSADSTVV